MSKVVDIRNLWITGDARTHRPGECAHRHIHLDNNGGVVTCAHCKATLSHFWALSMLASQYELALENIARLTKRLSLADERIAAMSAQAETNQIRSKDAPKSDDQGID